MERRITNVIGVDNEHLEELRISYQSWQVNKPELAAHPTLFICDAAQGGEADWLNRLGWYKAESVELHVFDGDYLRDKGATQREVMLTAITHGLTKVRTDWWLKIDTDTVATESGKWMDEQWLTSDPTFVSHRWGYTKPAAFIKRLDDWADNIPSMSKFERPEVELPDDLTQRVHHRRIQSILMLGKKSFADVVWRMVTSGGSDRMPCPSQDTLMWYVAERLKMKYIAANLKRFGWSHGRRALKSWTGN